jgi:hypothetical protein
MKRPVLIVIIVIGIFYLARSGVSKKADNTDAI